MKRDERPTFSSRKMPKDHYRCLTVRFSPTFDESLSVIVTEREEDKDVVDSCRRFLHWETPFYQKQSRLAHDLVDGMGEAAVAIVPSMSASGTSIIPFCAITAPLVASMATMVSKVFLIFLMF